MKIAFITSGAAGMFCGSCLRDNTLVNALRGLGHDALLIPTYTPIRTDEPDASERRVFFGGVNVYLQQKSWFFRHTPRFLDRLFNFNALLRWVSRFAVRTKYGTLGALTVSMLQGRDGNQAKEVAKLTEWLKNEMNPEVVILSNALLSGVLPEVKRSLGVPILVTLQGDDIFLDALPEPYRKQSIDLIRRNDAAVDGYISTSRYYADHMSGYLGLDRAKIHVVYPGLNLAGHGGEKPARESLAIGYFARIAPEKGFHNLVDAFILLAKNVVRHSVAGGAGTLGEVEKTRGDERIDSSPEAAASPPPRSGGLRLKASGWLGENNRAYFEEQKQKLAAAGLLDRFEYVDSPTHVDKVRFLQSVDVFSVPTTYHEPKGLYVLEAWANGVPVVQPRHGSFPELIESAGGGLLVEPDDPAALADGLQTLLNDRELRERFGRAGQVAVRERFTAEAMARNTLALLERFVRPT